MSDFPPPDLDQVRRSVRAVLSERLDQIALYPAAILCSITGKAYRVHRDTLAQFSPFHLLDQHIRGLNKDDVHPSAWVAFARVLFTGNPIAGPAALEAPNAVHCLLSSYAVDEGRPMEFFA